MCRFLKVRKKHYAQTKQGEEAARGPAARISAYIPIAGLVVVQTVLLTQLLYTHERTRV